MKEDMLVLTNARFVGALTEGWESSHGNLLLQDGRIKEILPIGAPLPEAAGIFDCEGKTVLPGFFEMHAHLYSFFFDSYRQQFFTPGEVLFGACRFAQEYLKAGYTTVRDCGSTDNVVAELRKAIAEGIVKGPRLSGCGLILTPTEVGNESFQNLYGEADGKDAMIAACRKEFQKGNDFIKVMVSGAFLNEGADPGLQIITEEELRACVEIAALKGSYVCAHCHGTGSIKLAVRCGVGTVEHGTFIDDEGIELLKETKNCFLVPTAAITEYMKVCDVEMSDDVREKCEIYYETERENIYKAYKSGLTLGFGSDFDLAAFLEKPGFEFIARKTFYGFDNVDILKQATINSAKIMKLDHDLGTVKAGKIADLVVIDGNPDEDIFVMEKTPVHVFKSGCPVDL